MVTLNREVHEPEPGPLLPAGERAPERAEGAPAAEVPDVRQNPKRRVHRMPRRERGPATVRYSGARTNWLPPRSGALASADRELQRKLTWCATFHLNEHCSRIAASGTSVRCPSRRRPGPRP